MDVTERQRGEQAIARLAAIVTSSGDAIVGMDLQGTVTSWNRAAERLYGYQAPDMLGQSVNRIIPPDRQHEEPLLLEEVAAGNAVDHYETVRMRKDGTTVQVSLSVSPVMDAQGRVIGASKIARDITERKRAEAALVAANEALEHQKVALADAVKELESFSYSVSHDLRAPLRTIDAFSRIIHEEHEAALDDEAKRCLGIVRKAAVQAGELIDDLLEFSRLGRQSMQLRTIDMTELANEAAEEVSRAQEGRSIDIAVASLPPCRGDARLVKLIWANLLGNAVKYTQYLETARIEVGSTSDETDPEAIVYYVRDNGVGFNMAYVHKLFGVFQRLHKKEEFEGTGVGLAIVHRIVHRHGGRVWADGVVNGGATFYFSLRKATA
jgi:PAS domain S-box-containing protein